MKIDVGHSRLARLCLVIVFLPFVVAFSPNVIRFRSQRFALNRQGLPKTSYESIQWPSQATQDTSLSVIITPLVASSDTWGNVAALTGMASISQVIGKTTAIGRLLGPPVTAMALSFLLASVGVLNPGGTAASKALQLLSLQLATPLILLGADLRDCLARCGPLLPSFFVAAVATVIACLAGWSVAGSMMTKALGKDGLIIAAALMAKNIGGGINYIAVCRCLSASPTAVAAGLCVDNIFALLYFPATNALGAGLPDLGDFQSPTDDMDDSQTTTQPSVSVQNVSSALFIASALLWLGEKVGGAAGALPCCTLLTVAFASWAPRRWISPVQPASDVLGTCALYLFFATAGAPGIAVADSVKASLIPISIFLSFLYIVHGAILAVLNRIWGDKVASFAPQRLLVSSSAAIGGPATSAALCQANGWKSLLVPSLIVGNIGYTIATFCALAFHSFLGT
jgi:uncharacterized membrane protein